MTDRERLIELQKTNCKQNKPCVASCLECMADHLIANGVTITPAVPGPSESDLNIMELCFHNGERHMWDKIKTSLLKLSSDMPCVTISQVIKIMEDLQ